MAELTCVDGTVLSVLPEPCRDRDGTPYEVTLRLLLDGRETGAVGERCGFFLAATAARLRAAGPEAFPVGSVEGGLRAWAADEELDPDQAWASLSRYLPRERELFAFRSREPDDVSVAGELRAVLDSAQLLAFLDRLLADCAEVGAWYDGVGEAAGLRRPVG